MTPAVCLFLVGCVCLGYDLVHGRVSGATLLAIVCFAFAARALGMLRAEFWVSDDPVYGEIDADLDRLEASSLTFPRSEDVAPSGGATVGRVAPPATRPTPRLLVEDLGLVDETSALLAHVSIHELDHRYQRSGHPFPVSGDALAHVRVGAA